MLSDAELVRLCAEKVMGWKEVHSADQYSKRLKWFRVMPPRGSNAQPYVIRNGHANQISKFDPLNNETDCADLLDKMAADGWYWCVQRVYDGPLVQAEFSKGEYLTDSWAAGVAAYDDRKRAVVLAALKAKGVNVEV